MSGKLDPAQRIRKLTRLLLPTVFTNLETQAALSREHEHYAQAKASAHDHLRELHQLAHEHSDSAITARLAAHVAHYERLTGETYQAPTQAREST